MGGSKGKIGERKGEAERAHAGWVKNGSMRNKSIVYGLPRREEGAMMGARKETL